MGKIWLKAPDPQGNCCDCAARANPCDSCQCAAYIPNPDYDGTTFSDLSEAQAVMAANQNSFGPENASHSCSQYCPLNNASYIPSASRSCRLQSCFLLGDVVTNDCDCNVTIDGSTPRSIAIYTVQVKNTTDLTIGFNLVSHSSTVHSPNERFQIDIVNVANNTTYTYSTNTAGLTLSGSHIFSSIPAGTYNIELLGDNTGTAFVVGDNTVMDTTLTDATPSNMSLCAIVAKYLNGLETDLLVCVVP